MQVYPELARDQATTEPTTEPAPARRGRYPALAGLRGLVVTAVVGYHALRMGLTRHGGNWGDVSALWWWAGTARFGVDMFFVLSGFLVVDSWRSCRRRAATTGAAVREFAARRAWRVLPPFWASVAVFGTAALVAGSIGWGDMALLAGGQQYLDGHLPAQVNLPFWSLTTEIHFYLLVPAVAWLFHRVGGWPLVAAAAVLSIWWVQAPVRGDLPASWILGRSDQFLVGVVAADLVRRAGAGERPRLVEIVTRPRAGWVLLGALVALGTYHGATFQGGVDNWLVWATHPLAGLILGALVVRLACGPPVAICGRPVWRFLGIISYSLYLWHYPVLDHGFDWFGLRDPDRHQSLLALLAAVVVLVAAAVTLAAAAYLAVERPAARRKRGRRPSAERSGRTGGLGRPPAEIVPDRAPFYAPDHTPSHALDRALDRGGDGGGDVGADVGRRLPLPAGPERARPGSVRPGRVHEELHVAARPPQRRRHDPGQDSAAPA